MSAVVAWRLFAVYFGEPYLYAPYTTPKLYWDERDMEPGPCAADPSHEPPAAGCECGMYACTALPPLAEWATQTINVRTHEWQEYTAIARMLAHPPVLADPAMGYGAAGTRYSPDTSIRAAWLELTGPVFVHTAVDTGRAAAIAAQYGVEVQRVNDLATEPAIHAAAIELEAHPEDRTGCSPAGPAPMRPPSPRSAARCPCPLLAVAVLHGCRPRARSSTAPTATRPPAAVTSK